MKRISALSLPCLFLATTFALHSALASGSSETPVDDVLDRLAVGLVASLPETLNRIQPGARECPKGSVATPPPPQPETGDVGIYTCEMSVEDKTPRPGPSPTVATTPMPSPSRLPYHPFAKMPGRKSIYLSTDNDNMAFGAIQSGNDTGYTVGGKVGGEMVLPEKSKLGKEGDVVGFEVDTELYTAEARQDWSVLDHFLDDYSSSRANGKGMRQSNGSVQWITVAGVDAQHAAGPNEFAQQFLAVNRFKAYKEWDRQNFFVTGAVAFESRQDSGKTVITGIQHGWHKDILNTYVWKNFGANGQKGSVTTKKVGEDVDPVTGHPVDIVRLEATPEIAPDQDLAQFGDWATTVSGGIGKRVESFQGRCQLQATVSADLVVQGRGWKTKLDPNSKIEVDAQAKASLLKNKKWNDSRLNFTGAGGLMYFPTTFDETTRQLVVRSSAELESLSHVGKKGSQLGVALQIFSPGGGGLYQKVDDRDAIMRVAVRYLFGGTAKK